MKKLFTGLLLALLAANTFAADEVKINDDFIVEQDGTFVLANNATVWRDELQPLIGKKLYDGGNKQHVKYDLQEFTVVFQDNAEWDEELVMNIQLNHDWDGITPLQPHLHWFQNQNATPNWLIAYRWHQNGKAKVQDWTYQAVEVNPTVTGGNAFVYPNGQTILQISGFPDITPPAALMGVSSVLQLKLMRDTKNDSAEYTATDPYNGDAHALSLDIHMKINTMGSRTEYTK